MSVVRSMVWTVVRVSKEYNRVSQIGLTFPFWDKSPQVSKSEGRPSRGCSSA